MVEVNWKKIRHNRPDKLERAEVPPAGPLHVLWRADAEGALGSNRKDLLECPERAYHDYRREKGDDNEPDHLIPAIDFHPVPAEAT